MKLVVADLSNIEGRCLAYLAGEEWKLEAFRAYDAGTGPDLYNITASGIIGIDPYKISKKDRNVFGKVPDLALGYEGGAGALQTFAKAYGVKMADQWETIQQNIAAHHVDKARDNLERFGRTQLPAMEIDELEWLASETVKVAWRARHPATRSLWYEAKDAAIVAIRNPGLVIPVGRHLVFDCLDHPSGRWLRVKLPSGKYLTYFDPMVDQADNITYMGYGTENAGNTASMVKVWTRIYTYGGKIIENATQAFAGDVMKYPMPRIDSAGYEIVLTVHDEAVTQAPDLSNYSAEQLASMMATPPPWAPDLPLAAAGFESYRYKKED